MCVCVCVYCLANLICSFFFSSLLCPFLDHHHFSLYYFSITFPIRLIAQGCVFFFCLCECSFLVNRLKFEKKRKRNQEKQFKYVLDFSFHYLWFFFSSSSFCYPILSVLSSFGYTSRLIKQNRSNWFLREKQNHLAKTRINNLIQVIEKDQIHHHSDQVLQNVLFISRLTHPMKTS